jgi:catechol 2,3-dioxygenase-like lactoylglutathione lyase family enzyme
MTVAAPVATTKLTLQNILHISVKTADVPGTVEFYRDLLGMMEVDRPAFDFPGAWLATPPPTGGILIHLYGGKTALNASGVVPTGGGAIDHVAIGGVGFEEMRQKLMKSGKQWRQNIPPGTQLWQLFIRDPNGILIELTFDGSTEAGPGPKQGTNWYSAYDNF